MGSFGNVIISSTAAVRGIESGKHVLDMIHRCSTTLRVGHLCASRDSPQLSLGSVESAVAQNI